MCDPITATVIGVVGSLASAMVSYSQQSALMSAQENANAQWVQYQRQKQQQEWARQEEQRRRANASRTDTLSQLEAGRQKEAQTTEEQRVQQNITPQELVDQNPQLLNDRLLQTQANTDPTVKQYIGERITQASKDARQRIANLATIQSYGTSQFGLQNRAQDLFNQSGQNIDLANNIRRGSLGALRVEQAVQPLHYSASPSMAGGIAGALAGIAGRGMGSSFGGGGGGGFTFDGAPVAASSVFMV